jgi:hypothetical protein
VTANDVKKELQWGPVGVLLKLHASVPVVYTEHNISCGLNQRFFQVLKHLANQQDGVRALIMCDGAPRDDGEMMESVNGLVGSLGLLAGYKVLKVHIALPKDDVLGAKQSYYTHAERTMIIITPKSIGPVRPVVTSQLVWGPVLMRYFVAALHCPVPLSFNQLLYIPHISMDLDQKCHRSTALILALNQWNVSMVLDDPPELPECEAKVKVATEKLQRELGAIDQQVDQLVRLGVITRVANADPPLPTAVAKPEATESAVEAAARDPKQMKLVVKPTTLRKSACEKDLMAAAEKQEISLTQQQQAALKRKRKDEQDEALANAKTPTKRPKAKPKAKGSPKAGSQDASDPDLSFLHEEEEEEVKQIF